MVDSKVVIITGASSGIGKGIALHLASIGYKKLSLVARREELLAAVAEECRQRLTKSNCDLKINTYILSSGDLALWKQ